MPRQQRSLVDDIPFLGERDLMTDARRETLRPPSRVGMRMLLVAALVALGSLTTAVPATADPSCPTVGVDGTVTPAITPGADLRGCNLTGANLTGADLAGIHFEGANLTNATLTNATLANANMWDATLTGVRSGGIVAPGLTWPNGWNFSGGFFFGPGADLSGASLSAYDLSSQQLSNANLSGADLSDATLTTTDLTNANVSNATLTDATLTGVGADGANFSGANLSGAHIIGSVFSSADMTNANLSGATIAGPSMSLNPTGLSGANFTGATLYQVVITPYTYDSSGSALTVTYYSDSSATSVTFESLIPGFSVTTIASGGLGMGDSALAITLPQSLTTLDHNALGYSAATTLTFLGDVPHYESDSFSGSDDVLLLQYRPAYQANWMGAAGTSLAAALNMPGRVPIYQVTFSAAGSGVSGTPASASALQTLWNQPITVSAQGTLARPGYTFAGWSTSFDGPPVGSTYMPTQDTVLYSTWTANSTGGGSSAASTATSSPATATTSVVTAPGPSPTTVPSGQATALIGGVPTEVTRTPVSAGGGFSLSAGSIAVRATPPPTGFTAGSSSAVTMSGFAPDSGTGAYLFSEPVTLGTLHVDAGGVATGRITIPASVPPGEHTVQFTGWTSSNEPVILSAGITVKPKVTRVQTTITFADGSTKVRAPGHAAVSRAVAGTAALPGSWSTTVTYPGMGVTRKVGRARAAAVAQALRAAGLTGTIRIAVEPHGQWGALRSDTVRVTSSSR